MYHQVASPTIWNAGKGKHGNSKFLPSEYQSDRFFQPAPDFFERQAFTFKRDEFRHGNLMHQPKATPSK